MQCIYAVDSKYGLSKKGSIPWKCPLDLTFFYHQTVHHIVIMGKYTYFSIPKQYRPLKNRLNIVLSTTTPCIEKHSNLLWTHDCQIYEEILKNKKNYLKTYPYLHPDFQIFFIGGKSIYDKFIPLCDIIWVTYVKKDYQCDLFLFYDYSKDFDSELFFENEELSIIKYRPKWVPKILNPLST